MNKLLALVLGIAVLATLSGLATAGKPSKQQFDNRAAAVTPTPTPKPNAVRFTDYTLDGAGNRAAVDKATPTPKPKAITKIKSTKSNTSDRAAATTPTPTPKAKRTRGTRGVGPHY